MAFMLAIQSFKLAMSTNFCIFGQNWKKQEAYDLY